MKNSIKFTTSVFVASLLFLVSATSSLATCPGATNKSIITVVGGDTCTVPAANTYVIDVATGENSTVGTGLATNGGSITINNTGTLRLGSATFGGGTLTVQAGGTFNAGLAFWVADGDADNYPSSYTVVTATASGKRRLGLMSSTSTLDCNDAAKSYTNTCYAYSQSAYYGYGQGGYYGYGQGSYYFYSQGSYYGYGQGYYCFLNGTKIKMADGTSKEIQEVKPGEEVLSYNIKDKTLTKEKVDKLIIHKDIKGKYLTINGNLKVTPNHPLLINGIWQHAGSARVNDKLTNSNGNTTTITDIELSSDGTNDLYNLHLIGREHNYFAEDILVHNK